MHMNPPADADIRALLAQLGRSGDYSLTPCSGGFNNRTWRLDHADGPVLLKQYFEGPWPRLQHEFGFLSFANRQGISNVPAALASLPESHLALYSWVEGEPYRQVGESEVEQALAFIQSLQAHRHEASELPRASEFCARPLDHVLHLRNRIARLDELSDPEINELVQTRMLPLWKKLDARLAAAPELNQPYTADELCLSPSDFGFHNALKTHHGPVFIDFEYAGWDDPAQLVCDFFCQFEVPAPSDAFDSFAAAFAAEFIHPESQVARMLLMMPVHRFKWLCIALNHFLPQTTERRQFAGSGARDTESQRLRIQNLIATLY